MAKKKEEKSSWNELCDYVKREILEYDENMKFPKYLALKLQGLKKGEHIANKNIRASASYDDFTILCAFKLNKNKIVKYLHDNEAKINGEGHRINLIIKMIEPEINDVYLRLQNTKKVQKRVADKDFENQVYEGAMYTPKTTEVSEKMKSLF